MLRYMYNWILNPAFGWCDPLLIVVLSLDSLWFIRCPGIFTNMKSAADLIIFPRSIVDIVFVSRLSLLPDQSHNLPALLSVVFVHRKNG